MRRSSVPSPSQGDYPIPVSVRAGRPLGMSARGANDNLPSSPGLTRRLLRHPLAWMTLGALAGAAAWLVA